MPLIKVNTPEQAQTSAGLLIAAELGQNGFISNASLFLSARPEVLAAWQTLQNSIRSHLSPRRAALVGFSTALALRSTYCAQAQALTLAQLFSAPELESIALDYHKADLETVEVALMDFAQTIALHAYRVTSADVGWLHSLGVSDAEIGDVTLAVAAQSFFCRIADGLEVEPDPPQRALDPDLRSILALGRHFD